MTRTPSPEVCAKCGLPVRLWAFGWKHSGGGRSGKACSSPQPVKREDYDALLDSPLLAALGPCGK